MAQLAALLDWSVAHPWSLYLLAGLLSLVLARKSQVDAWVEHHPRIGGLLKTLRGIGLDPWIILQGLSLMVLGRLPEKPKVDLEPKAKAPKVPPSGIALLLLMVCLGIAGGSTVQACASQQTKAQMVESSKAIAFNSACVALALLDQQEARYLDSIANPTEAQVKAAQLRVSKLKAARLALQVAREWIEGDQSRDGDQAIRDGVKLLREVVGLLEAEGVDVPNEAKQALDLLGGVYL